MQKVEHGVFSRLRSVRVVPGLLVLAVLIISPLIVKDEYTRHLMVVSMYFGAQAMVSDFTLGFINITNFGFSAFVGVGGYTSALLVIHFGIHPAIGLIAGAIAAGILGFFTGILTLRLRGFYVSIMAWFMALALQALTAVWVDLTRGHWGLFVPPLLDTMSVLPYFYILLLITVTVYVVIKKIVDSRVGLAFRAIGQDVDYARASGINPTKYKMIAFTLSCAFAGLIGGYYAHFIGILTPDIMSTLHTVEVTALNIIGGRGSIWGPLLAAFLVIPTFESLKSLMEIRLIIYGLLLMATIVFYPAGLVGILQTVWERIRGRES
jgi:branched-chain amino acid transport system permease protein